MNFETKEGLKQDGLLNHLLFAILMNKVIKKRRNS